MTGCGGRSGLFERLAASIASKHGHVNPAQEAPTHQPHQLTGEEDLWSENGGSRRGPSLTGRPRYSEDPIVSSDIVADPSSCIFDRLASDGTATNSAVVERCQLVHRLAT